MNTTLSLKPYFVKGNAAQQIPDKYSYSDNIKFKIFASLWAIATLFHFANKGAFTEHFHEFALTVSAIVLLFKPGSLLRFFAFIFFQLYDTFVSIPSISNHWIFTAIVNITIVYAYLFLAVKEKSFSIDSNKLLKTFAPIAKIEVFILYFYVVFHKLNSGFFNTDVSCATEFYLSQNAYGILPNTKELLLANAFFTVGVEALIPIMLCIKRTRNLGILLGLLFHFVIAYNPINGFYDFSSMIFALYVLFTDQAFVHQVIKVFNNIYKNVNYFGQKFFKFSYFKLVIIAGLALGAFLALHLTTKGLPDYMRHIVWTCYSLSFISILLLSLFKRKQNIADSDNNIYIPHWTFIVFPLIVLFNGLCPYLGLKTEYSFAMFSNLRTEGGVTNHYIMPVSTQVFNFQKDLVQVISSSDPEIQKMANESRLYTFHSFKQRVQINKPESLTYIRNGKQQIVNYREAPKNHELRTPIPFYQKLLKFRGVNRYGEQPCSH